MCLLPLLLLAVVATAYTPKQGASVLQTMMGSGHHYHKRAQGGSEIQVGGQPSCKGSYNTYNSKNYSNKRPRLTASKQKEIEETILRPWFTQQTAAGNRAFAGVARLCYHDAGTFDPADCSGGTHAYGARKCTEPNACEYTAPENTGLPKWIDALDELYNDNNLSGVLSKADFWQMTCSFGIEMTSGLSLKFKAGRTDSQESSPRFPCRLPDAFDFSEVERVFINRLGFSWIDTVGLIGVHTLGGCHPEFSGYQGDWDRTPDTFDKSYFSAMVKATWAPHTIVTPQPEGKPDLVKHQFSIPGNSFNRTVMLQIDMGLLFDLDAEGCDVQSKNCPDHEESAVFVRSWADSEELFFNAFVPAWEKMQNSLTCDKLYDVVDEPQTTPRPTYYGK